LRNRRLSGEGKEDAFDEESQGGSGPREDSAAPASQGDNEAAYAGGEAVAVPDSDADMDMDESTFKDPDAEHSVMSTDDDEHSEADNDDNGHDMDGGLGDVNGGFLGDFEEIEEDEDVERFMSQNNTPSMSTRQSPETRSLHVCEAPTAHTDGGNSSDENEDSFEPISEPTAAGMADDGSPKVNGHTLQPAASGGPTSLSPATNGAAGDAQTAGSETQASQGRNGRAPSSAGCLLPDDMARLRALQEEFRQSNIPKLPANIFFTPDVYRRCSVLPALASTGQAGEPVQPPESTVVAPTAPAPAAATTTAAAAAPTAARPAAPAPAPQKPSSLRSGGQQSKASVATAAADSTDVAAEAPGLAGNNASGDAGEQQPVQPAAAPESPLRRHTRSRSSLNDQGDVMDTLLGAMGSPSSRGGQPQPKPAADVQQTIPNDMLVAMMAMEGGSVEAVTKAPAGAGGLAKAMAVRLPKGYTGPFSLLTVEEHGRFVALAHRAKAGALGAKEGADYQRLKAKVDIEQQKYRAGAREKALPLLRHIGEGVGQHACREWSRVGAAALGTYPRMYAPVRVRAIRSSASGYVPFVYKDTLYQRGVCHHIANALSGPAPAAAIASDADPWAAPRGGADTPQRHWQHVSMSQDAVAASLADAVGADVAVSASALIALLTLPQAYAQDVIIPFRVIAGADAEDAEDESPAEAGRRRRRRVVFDKPLLPAHAATPRRLGQMYYDQAVRAQAVDAGRPLELSGGSMARLIAESEATGAAPPQNEPGSAAATSDAANANYTLWEFGGLRVLIRYGVHGFVHGDGAAAAAKAPGGQAPPSRTTVTLAVKMERQLGNKSPEAALAAAGGEAYEDIGESERLAWWMACYLRGNPSEVWVSHVDVHKSTIARVTRHTCSDMYPATDASGSAQPSTRGVQDLLQDLLRLPAGQYMLAHRRRTWDATIYKALENQDARAAATASQRTKEAVMDLSAELRPVDPAALAQVDVEDDYVPAAWHGAPGQIPFTYAPADLAVHHPAGAAPWKGGSAARGRRRPGSKKKKAKHA
ncbi:hypothetical protein LPJ61_000699, partial [Coemansia biformis]